jgi:hypothetical protein
MSSKDEATAGRAAGVLFSWLARSGGHLTASGQTSDHSDPIVSTPVSTSVGAGREGARS